MRTRKGGPTLFLKNWRAYFTDPYYKARLGEIFYHIWMQLIYSERFDFLLSPKKKDRRRSERAWLTVNDPRGQARQIGDWKKMGPKNPPPGVRASADEMNRILNDLDMRERHRRILSKEGD